MYKRSFWEVGQWLQETAKNEEEAKKRFSDSCNKCNKQAFCNEKFCPIAKTHEIRLLVLDAENANKGRVRRDYIVKTRKYEISKESLMKRELLTFFTRLRKVVTKEDVITTLEDAEVMVELGETESAYWVLRNAKLNKTAQKFQNIVEKYKEAE